MPINRNDYVAKITSATPLGLTLITFELGISYIDEAINLFYNDTDASKVNLKKAQQCINNLIDSLDMSYEISLNLADLYIYCNKLLIKATFNEELDTLHEVRKILSELYSGFSQIEDNSNVPVMEHADIIYSGLTYKNGKLNEYVDKSNSKDFQA